MKEQQYVNISNKHYSTTIAMLAIVVLFMLLSCSNDKKNVGSPIEEPDSISYLSTYGVTTLISDSGRISYKIEAEEWHIYEKRNPKYWAFEKGAYLEKYDDSLRIEATIKSDTAYFFSDMKLWKLIGNVNIRNQKNERFFTDLLYWDQEKGDIYSDKYIKIEQEDQVTTGIGFRSNQALTNWEILSTEGIYTIEDRK
ncbi:MAG: LPS export ABC transporter periplasmic protein LptC [Bacteroidaceae bacterium]|jgi:LPS export ABC transporter protein LptC|nr:LPS export ABC transporter periplasmic protein LptC [Bacteroidaceae bacterium]